MKEKKLMEKKKAPIEDVENLLPVLEKLATGIEDYWIENKIFGLIEDICKEKCICPLCYLKIDEDIELCKCKKQNKYLEAM